MRSDGFNEIEAVRPNDCDLGCHSRSKDVCLKCDVGIEISGSSEQLVCGFGDE